MDCLGKDDGGPKDAQMSGRIRQTIIRRFILLKSALSDANDFGKDFLKLMEEKDSLRFLLCLSFLFLT